MSDVRRQPHTSPKAERYLSDLADALAHRAPDAQDSVLRSVRNYIDGSTAALGRDATAVDYVRILDHLGSVEVVARSVQRGTFTAPDPLPPPEEVYTGRKSILGGVSVIFGLSALVIFWVPIFGTTLALMAIIVALFARKSRGVNHKFALIGLLLGVVAALLSIFVIFASVLTGDPKPEAAAPAEIQVNVSTLLVEV